MKILKSWQVISPVKQLCMNIKCPVPALTILNLSHHLKKQTNKAGVGIRCKGRGRRHHRHQLEKALRRSCWIEDENMVLEHVFGHELPSECMSVIWRNRVGPEIYRQKDVPSRLGYITLQFHGSHSRGKWRSRRRRRRRRGLWLCDEGVIATHK